MKIQVTNSGYDNIGTVLTSMNINFDKYNGSFDCDLLFLNCGTSDKIKSEALYKFVNLGGTLYASDLTSSIIQEAFPSIFKFDGNIGRSGKKQAVVIDKDLKKIVGEEITINFDMSSWSVLNSINKGSIILASKEGNPYMVHVPINNGAIFYTCFHNHTQANEQEQTLLKLLVLKQIAQHQSISIQDASKSLDINLDSYQGVFKGGKSDESVYPLKPKKVSKLRGSLTKKEETPNELKQESIKPKLKGTMLKKKDK